MSTIPLFLSLSLALGGEPVPVYLKANHPAPTGHYERELLKQNQVGRDQFEWLWVRHDKLGSGWILKSEALLPLDFSRQAIIHRGETVHSSPHSHSTPKAILNESQRVNLVDRKGSWYKIIYKEQDKNASGWVRSQQISPSAKDAGLFFATQSSTLRKSPSTKSKPLLTIPPGEPLIPIKTQRGWAQVQYKGRRGYIPMKRLKSRMDVSIKVRTDKGYFKPHPALFEQKIHEIFANPIWAGTGPFTLDLKQQPDMGSETLATIEPWQDLSIQGYSVKEWGLSHIDKLGKVWWPDKTLESDVELTERYPAQLVQLNKEKIYQIEKSPLGKSLYFASATTGVYRSYDGKNWQPLKNFKHGYPIKVAKNGVLFVADKVSFDHGENFQDFIRWDLIFDKLPNKDSISMGALQIVNVEPHGKDHKGITLSLKAGDNTYYQLQTEDMGRNWSLR